jgi:hypothetical protein
MPLHFAAFEIAEKCKNAGEAGVHSEKRGYFRKKNNPFLAIFDKMEVALFWNGVLYIVSNEPVTSDP